MGERIEEIRKRLTTAGIKGPLTAELDIFDPDGLEIEASVFDEKLTFLYTSGTGVTHKGDNEAERNACWEAAKAALPVAELFANAPADLEFLLAEVDRLKVDQTTATFTGFSGGSGLLRAEKLTVSGPGNFNLLAFALDLAPMATVKDGAVEIRIDNASALLLEERDANARMSGQLARIKAALMAAGCSDYTDDVAKMAEEYLAQPEEE